MKREVLDEVPIVSVCKGTFEFLDAEGNYYSETESGIWAKTGPIKDGSIGYHGSGSHGGHVVLKPFYLFNGGSWERLYSA